MEYGNVQNTVEKEIFLLGGAEGIDLCRKGTTKVGEITTNTQCRNHRQVRKLNGIKALHYSRGRVALYHSMMRFGFMYRAHFGPALTRLIFEEAHRIGMVNGPIFEQIYVWNSLSLLVLFVPVPFIEMVQRTPVSYRMIRKKGDTICDTRRSLCVNMSTVNYKLTIHT